MLSLRATTTRRLLLTLPCLAWVSAAQAVDSVVLKPKYDGPTEAYVEFDTDVVQKMAGPDGKLMEIKVRSVYGLLQKTTPKGDTVEIGATLDRILGFMSFGESMQTLYDTDDPDYPDASPMHRDTFGPILNMGFKITLDGKGLATAVEGGEPIREKLVAMGEGNFVAKSLAEADFTDRQIMSAFGEMQTMLYPFRKVKVGETWKKSQNDEFPQVGKVIVQYDCKLDRIEKSDGRESAIVSYRGTIAKDPDEKPEKDKRLGKIDGTFSGTAKFDVKQGRFVEIVRETKAKIEVPPFWTQDPAAPLLKIDAQLKMVFKASPIAVRRRRKADIAQRVVAAAAKRKAEEAAAMAGPVDPVTPANAAVAWLQWGGPDRNFCSDATGLANRWLEGGPPKLWERTLGDGFSAILCDGDRLYTMYALREKEDEFKGEEVVVALDAKTGKTLWEHKYDAPWPKDFQMEFGPGPHSTPIIVGDRLFTVGCTAKLVCLDKKTGRMIWSKDLHEEYKADLLERGYGASPLAYKGNILLPVSKEKGHAVMAFRQSDGSLAWKGGDFQPGYASLLVIEAYGKEQLVAFGGKTVRGLDPANGNNIWKIEHPTQWGANIATPIWDAEDNHLFISSAYGMGSRGIKLQTAGSQVVAKEVWFNPKMKIQHASAVRIGEWIYGSSGDFGPSILSCLNARTGEFAWRKRGIAKANVLFADGKLIVLDEDGSLFMVKADAARYQLLGKAPDLCKKTAWTVPTLVGRTLYIRDREKIMALDLSPRADNNWPSFRGPQARGVSEGGPTPTRWSVPESKGVKWKTPIPGLALSSPVVWGDRVFITTAVSEGGDESLKVGLYGNITPVNDDSVHAWQVLCLDKATGAVKWKRTAYQGVPKVKRHTKASHANSTPATDGKHVVAFFGSEGLYCYNVEGKLLWQKDLGLLDAGYYKVPAAQWGFGSSPIIFEGRVIVQCDVQKDSFIAAFDVGDGTEMWRTPRDEVPTWSTPTVYTGGEHPQIIVNGYKHIGGYDVRTGKELWRMTGGGDIPVPTPVVAHDLIFVTNAHGGGAPLYAIRPGATGDISLHDETSNEHIAWSVGRNGAYMQTPLVYGDLLYSCTDGGVLMCYEARTGRQLYRARLGSGGGFTASPVAADGKIYFTSEEGDVFVVQAGPEFKILATNPLGEICMATPAISQGMLLFRTQGHVVAIAE